MIESRGTWTDLIAGVGLEIAEVFDQGQEEYIPGLGAVISSKPADGAQKNITGKTGVGELARFDDGDDVPGGRRYKTYTTSIIWNNYGKYIQVTKNTIEDRDYSAELNEMKDLSVGANFSQDASAMQLFNGGFATTRDVNNYRMTWYGDAVPLTKNSGTKIYSNFAKALKRVTLRKILLDCRQRLNEWTLNLSDVIVRTATITN